MSFLTGLTNILGTSLFKEVKDVIKEYWPPDVSPKERLEAQIRIDAAETAKLQQINAALAESERMITERVTLLEGSAQDLRAIPLIGPVVLFLRGLQRPLWGYGTMYADCMWFMGRWPMSDQQESALWVINFLVLGFLFGERAVQNVAPLIADMMSKRRT